MIGLIRSATFWRIEFLWGVITFLEKFLGIQGSLQMFTEQPSPILHIKPCFNNWTPFKILLHVYELPPLQMPQEWFYLGNIWLSRLVHIRCSGTQVLWGTRRVNTPKSSADHLTPQFKQINIARSPGAHVATPLEDLCAELHTHTQYNAYQATQSHTRSSLTLIPNTLLIKNRI